VKHGTVRMNSPSAEHMQLAVRYYCLCLKMTAPKTLNEWGGGAYTSFNGFMYLPGYSNGDSQKEM